jgi:hypothetical protein
MPMRFNHVMSNQTFSVRYRIPIFAMGFICLTFGIYSGLLRLGYAIPWLSDELAFDHGPLMVSGFLGTVISLERAVAIGKRWAYLGSLCTALGGLSFIVGLSTLIGVALTTIASVTLSIATTYIFIRQRELFTFTLLLGSLSWLLGNLFWLNGFPSIHLMPWWISFLVLTIAGERLELSRVLPPSSNSKLVFVLIITLFLIGVLVATLASNINVQILSIALLALFFWLLRHDVARHTIKQSGLTRYIAACLISGYFWLLIGGLIGLFTQPLVPGSTYDAFLHTILVGFVFSMIFGHAPIIFPAVVNIKIPYHPTFYLPLTVLHVALAVRIAGDLLLHPVCRSIGGILNAIAIALFIITIISAIICNKRKELACIDH